MAPKFDPSPDDARIVAALAARTLLDAAFASQDAHAFEALTTPDFIVHAPNNAVLLRETALAAFRLGRMNYREGKASTIEYAAVRGEWVVLMGEEVIKPIPPASNAGKTLRRRFTDLWKDCNGTWKLAIRHATIVEISN
jgi:ketosteroid isomerase-like protein